MATYIIGEYTCREFKTVDNTHKISTWFWEELSDPIPVYYFPDMMMIIIMIIMKMTVGFLG